MMKALRRASNVLAKARHVYVLGQGKSFPVAFYLHFALLRLERPCTLLSGTGGGIAQQAVLIDRRDALVAVSFRPYTPQVIDIARERHRAGVPVIAITDSSLSPLWPGADGRVRGGRPEQPSLPVDDRSLVHGADSRSQSRLPADAGREVEGMTEQMTRITESRGGPTWSDPTHRLRAAKPWSV